MNVRLVGSRELYREARDHLRGHVEQVGFFLADFDVVTHAFVLREWHPMPEEAFEYQSALHVTLRDEQRPALIKWAWDAGASLVEVHSHAFTGDASFSPSDMWGFEEWVPHVRWRLQSRPYGAIVTAGDTFDGLAWIDDHGPPQQIVALDVEGNTCLATGRTLKQFHGGSS